MLDRLEFSAASKSVEASADRCSGELRNFELEVGEASFSSPLGDHIIVLRISQCSEHAVERDQSPGSILVDAGTGSCSHAQHAQCATPLSGP